MLIIICLVAIFLRGYSDSSKQYMGKQKKQKNGSYNRYLTDNDCSKTDRSKSDSCLDDFEDEYNQDGHNCTIQCDVEQAFNNLSMHSLDNDSNSDQLIVDGIDIALDKITDKRSNIKTQGIQQIAVILLDLCGRERTIANRAETIFDVLCGIFKRGSNTQNKILACQSLSAFAAFLANSELLDHESVFEQLCSNLLYSVSNADENESLRMAYISLLCAYQLLGIANECPFRKRELILSLENIFLECRLGGSAENLQEQAISCWCTLIPYSLKDDHRFTVASIERYISKANSLLQCSCNGIKFAAGQGLALVAELTREDSKINFVVSNELIDAVSNLVAECGKSQHKKDLLLQRVHFRNIEKSLKQRCYNDEIIQVNKSKLIINSWKLRYCYDFLNKILSNSFYKHLQNNAAVRQLLNFDGCSVHDMNSIPNCQYWKWADKKRYKERYKERSLRRDAKVLTLNDAELNLKNRTQRSTEKNRYGSQHPQNLLKLNVKYRCDAFIKIAGYTAMSHYTFFIDNNQEINTLTPLLTSIIEYENEYNSVSWTTVIVMLNKHHLHPK
ncbi:hypothetical protein GJ496_000835 [Pomphorhynchus laevis]|nr:hypothetical protein GJ496_000835 [Pomphorhynchus laevis]